jgi:ATP/maltotriose-dependent transcriptional regulator MalT
MMNSIVNTHLGRTETAERFQRRVREIADRSNRPFDRVAAACSGATLLLERGDTAAAVAILDEAFALAHRHGIRMLLPSVGWQRGVAYLEQERLDEAKHMLVEACEMSKSIGYKSVELRASISLAHALSRNGDVREALEMLRAATNTCQQQGFGGLEAEARLLQAVITPVADEETRDAVILNLKACIAIAARNGATPLALKAETVLSGIVGSGADVRLA